LSFARHSDPRCQRGLTFVYRYGFELDAGQLLGALGPDLICAEQLWGERKVIIGILSRRFEVQIGVRDGELRFMHRMSATLDQRESDRAGFEAALSMASPQPPPESS
jgi:hypothetical protein